MTSHMCGWTAAVCLAASVLVMPAVAEIVYTPLYVSIPVGGYYNIDLNGDGITDFTLDSKLLQGWCQSGDQYEWSVSITPGNRNAIVTATDRAGSSYASALLNGVPVNSAQSFYPSASTMAEIYWGPCSTGTFGEWLNLPARYLGLQFQDAANQSHYGWAEVSTTAYVDQDGHLHAATMLFGFAYETVPNQEILTGQQAGAP
jgi:hypothetical protein